MEHKKEARVKNSCLSRSFRPSHCPLMKNKQCRSPRILEYIYLYAKPWDEEHCVIATLTLEFAKFKRAADKRCYTSLSICPVARLRFIRTT